MTSKEGEGEGEGCRPPWWHLHVDWESFAAPAGFADIGHCLTGSWWFPYKTTESWFDEAYGFKQCCYEHSLLSSFGFSWWSHTVFAKNIHDASSAVKSPWSSKFPYLAWHAELIVKLQVPESPESPLARHVKFQMLEQSESEEIDLDEGLSSGSSQTSSSIQTSWQSSPSTAGQSMHSSVRSHSPIGSAHSPPRSPTSPHASRHSRVRAIRQFGPAGNKKRHMAADIWTFYHKGESKKQCCIFCKYIISAKLLLSFFILIIL